MFVTNQNNHIKQASNRVKFKLLTPLLLKFNSYFSSLRRDDIVFGGIVTAFLLFLLLSGFAAYLFYSTAVIQRERPVVPVETQIIQEKDIDEALKILDERSQKSDEFLRD